jgi:hypothetical protein
VSAQEWDKSLEVSINRELSLFPVSGGLPLRRHGFPSPEEIKFVHYRQTLS